MLQKNILFLFDNLELSGADRIALDVANALVEVGVPVRLAVCMDVKDGFNDLPASMIRLSPPPAANESLLRRAWRGMVALKRCTGIAEKGTVVVCVTPPAAFVGLIASWFSGAQSVPWAHFDLAGVLREPLAARGIVRGLVQRFFYRHLVPFHRRVIFVSGEARSSMAQLTHRGRVPPGWTVLPNIVDTRTRAARSAESATVARIAALKAEGRRVVLFIGRIAHQKRWEDLITAAGLLERRAPACTLVMIGDGPERDMLETALGRVSLRNIEFLGPDPNPMPSLAMADALVLTSLYEAWPTVILEAFQLGVPVIAYDCPSGPREMLGVAGERGWLVRESATELALAVTECLVTDASELAKTRIRAAGYAERFLPVVAAKEWKAFIESV